MLRIQQGSKPVFNTTDLLSSGSTIRQCSFTNIYAYDSPIVNSRGVNLVITDSSIFNSSGYITGVISHNESSLNVQNTSVSKCSSHLSASAILVGANAQALISGGSFSQNRAEISGTIFVTAGSTLYCEGCKFT
jgi:hypothetical protein